jgi:Fe-S-cluster containining protein
MKKTHPIGLPVGNARHEAPLDCGSCGACCREAFDVVAVEPDDPMGAHPDLVRVHLDGWRSMCRVPGLSGKTRCAALTGDGEAAPWQCSIYADLPTTCRALEVGSEDCLLARRRVGLSDVEADPA